MDGRGGPSAVAASAIMEAQAASAVAASALLRSSIPTAFVRAQTFSRPVRGRALGTRGPCSAMAASMEFDHEWVDSNNARCPTGPEDQRRREGGSEGGSEGMMRVLGGEPPEVRLHR